MDLEDKLTGCGCLIIILVIVGLVGLSFVRSTVKATVTDMVVKTERITQERSSKYLVFGEDEVYQNTDSIWFGKFNSSDVYRNLQAGKTYRFEVAGWRVPFLSWYRNIVSYEEVPAE